MTTVYDLLAEHSNLNVLIGPTGPYAWKGGPKYVLFGNGQLIQEGEAAPYVGVDLTNACDVLPTALYNAIIERANFLEVDTVIIRLGTEDSPVERVDAQFSLIDRVYMPARYVCKTRVAFTNLAKGSHK